MSEHKSPLTQAVDEVLDLMVYGPLGLAITAREELPRMVEKGRHRLGGQVMLARMIGQHATRHGQRMASQALRQSTQTLVGLGLLPGDATDPGERAPAHEGRLGGPAPGTAIADTAMVTRPGTPDNGRVGRTAGEPRPASAELAIPGYDSLSASQVVQRLGGLAPDELEAVRSYEAAGRGRRTILNRIAQLQSGRP